MGLTYAEGMASAAVLGRRKLMILDKDEEKLATLRAEGVFEVHDQLEDCVPQADIIFLGVKPYHADALLEALRPLVNEEQIAVSLMAGVTIASIQEGMGIQKVVRTMPNLPAQVGMGVTSFTCSQEVSRVEMLMVRALLDTTGVSIKVKNENFIDASTGISGSGPAYVFYFMESMMEAALKMGFSPNDSKLLVSHTFSGAIALFNEHDLSPKKWMDRVASKGGTTRAALDSMKDNNVNELIKEAAFAAFDRAVELGQE